MLKCEKTEVAELKLGFLTKMMPCCTDSGVITGPSGVLSPDMISPKGSVFKVKSDVDLDVVFVQPAVHTSESICLRWCNVWPAKLAPKSIGTHCSLGKHLYGCPSPGFNHTATNTNAGWAHVAKQHMLSTATCPQCSCHYTCLDEMVKHLKSSGH